MLAAMIGGTFIGVAVSLMLYANGRVTGISGIIAGILTPKRQDLDWRIYFTLGLLLGGAVLAFVTPEILQVKLPDTTFVDYLLAGFLVGFGTLLGNGCTSGHGVCGISRFSMRSLSATIIFIIFGAVSVLLFKIFH